MAYLPPVTPRPTHTQAHRHMLAHEHTHLKTHIHLGKVFKRYTVHFSAMAHLRPLLPSFSSTSIYLWGRPGGSQCLAHFLSVCLPERCKQTSERSVFSLDLAWLQRRGLVETHRLDTSASWVRSRHKQRFAALPCLRNGITNAHTQTHKPFFVHLNQRYTVNINEAWL